MKDIRWEIIAGAALIGASIFVAAGQNAPRYSLTSSYQGQAFRIDHRTGEVLTCQVNDGCSAVFAADGEVPDEFEYLNQVVNSN